VLPPKFNKNQLTPTERKLSC